MNRVGLLIKKDIIYITTSLKSLFWMGVIFSFFLSLGNIMAAFIVPIAMGYLFTYAVFSYEEKNKMNLVIAALPVKRKDICLAKYLASIMYSLASMVFVIVGLLINISINKNYSMSFIIGLTEGLIGMFLIYNGVILPLIIYFGTLKSRWFMFGTYVLAFGFLGAGSSLSGKPQVQAFLQDKINSFSGVLVLLVGVMVYMISYCISLSLYQKKDFD